MKEEPIKRYRIYKKIRKPIKILHMRASLAFIYISIGFLMLFSFLGGISLIDFFFKVFLMIFLYVFFIWISERKKDWLLYSSKNIPSDIDLT